MGKLDTAAQNATTIVVDLAALDTGGDVVNGPEDLPPFDGDAWERVDWRRCEEQVRRLRGRIFKAGQGAMPLS